MTEQKRGKSVAIFGAVLQFIFTAVMLTIWLWTDSVAAMSCMWMLAGGILLWLMTILLFYCRQLERREAIELEEIAAHGGAGATIFDGEHSDAHPAAARLAVIERWGIPIFTLLWAAFHLTVGIKILQYLAILPRATALTSAPHGAVFTVLIGFMAFLFSRYATGMSTERPWRLLRATGSYLLINVLVITGALAALLASTQNYYRLDRIVAYVVPALQIVLSIELLLNFVLDLYRPRIAGQEQRPSFDSRLFNLVAQPGRVGHSLAETLNYQFGFEVSKTWFYQLLSRALTPLIVLGAVVLFAMSSIVIVHEGQEGIVFHFGQTDPERGTLKPGIHLKWPWPVDRCEMFDTGKIYEIVLGVGEERDELQRSKFYIKGSRVFLWTEEHGDRMELDFLVAKQPPKENVTKEKSEETPPPVNIIKLVVPVRYRISDPYRYGYNARNTQSLLEKIAYREMVKYCASATLVSPIGSDESERPEAIMTYGRDRAAKVLQKRIQKVADDLRLGLEVVYVGLEAVHPPSTVAPEYQKVSEMERRQDEKRYEARAAANELLAEVAGSPFSARKLALAIQVLGELEKLRNHSENRPELLKVLEEYTRRLGQNMKVIDKEIQRQKLLGKDVEDELAYRGNLESYMKILKAIRSGSDKFYFAREISKARQRADMLLSWATGQPARDIAEAVSYRWERELSARARFESFGREMLAYRACPEVYGMDRILAIVDEVLPKISKYVLGADPNKIQLWLNLEQQSDIMQGAFDKPMGE